MEKKPSFYMHLDTGVYYCHSCHARGTFVQFLRKMGSSPEQIDVALELEKLQPKRRRDPSTIEVGRGEHFLNEALLGVFQYCPLDLVDAGFDEKLLKSLDIGFDHDEQRITFPIRDLYGNLVGISGRTVVGDYPRYKVYKSPDLLKYAPDDYDTKERYKRYDIKNHEFLWNMHNVWPQAFHGELDTLVIVEGYKACIWVLQQDIENVVALQGSRMTWMQERILSRLGTSIVLLLDANKAGREGALDAGRRLRQRGLEVLVCTYPEEFGDEAQPDNLSQPELLAVLEDAEDWHHWRQRPCNIHLATDRRSANE
jgi:DNA primase